ncbi:hypothetical protein NADFUDRAFT_46191 [Nadsonia fulvescens var. elongata DSM 6958]|uniref:tRNA (guanine(9)-N1)-methyltransferase n=1 Tax=Nadsonia fulvescens var. elongata DSM 6958 TaxID=857566 RepID=A0A1E3PN35_9ASCO|nr:hypothetical protein NADFUDRAFT_46191 [Nadsonia fulvescens var. elongata DSM 6958]
MSETMSPSKDNDAVPENVTAVENKPLAVPHKEPLFNSKTAQIPEGMSKSAWKKQQKALAWESQKPDFCNARREKRKVLKAARRERKLASQTGEEVVSPAPDSPASATPRTPFELNRLNTRVIVDCGFDDLMTETERTSLASQVVRCYSENKKGPNAVNLTISSLNKKLLTRFNTNMRQLHLQWKNVEILERDFTLPTDPSELANWVYLSSDSPNTLDILEEGKTYIVGGIVDKGRYVDLCKSKAEKLGIQTAKLPINDYIALAGRKVLTTNHVFELLLKWFEVGNWKSAFEMVLPARKILTKKTNCDNNNVTASETPKTGLSTNVPVEAFAAENPIDTSST